MLVEALRFSSVDHVALVTFWTNVSGCGCLFTIGVYLLIRKRHAALQPRPLPRSRRTAQVGMSWTVVPVTAVAVAVTSGGCGSPPQTSLPVPSGPKTYLKFSNPAPGAGSEARCVCPGSRGAFIRNDDPIQRTVHYVVYKTDKISGTQFAPQDGTTVVPTTNSGENGAFLGCTIDDPGTSCRFDNHYEIRQVSAAILSTSRRRKRVVTSLSAIDCNPVCSASPGSGARNCLQLGVRFFSAVAPLVKLVEQGQATGTNVSRDAALKAAGMTAADDPCGRGDIIIGQGGKVSNRGTSNVCAFSSRDLPKAQLKALGIASGGTNPTRMYGVLPREFEMYAGASARGMAGGVLATTTEDAHAPYLAFSGAGSDKLTLNYGGPIHQVSRVNVPGRPPQTVLTTSNGCVAVAEKP